jgi:3-hydroxybutyryl-CoA dehydratase
VVTVGGKSIDDIEVGRSTRFSKTVSESDVYLFAGITGDLDPNHVDEEYASKTSLGHRVAHGALIVGYMSAASTRILEDFERPMVSVGYDRIRFIKPVYLGDTINVEYVIASLDRERERIVSKVEVKNQHGELVCVADHIMQLVD